MAFERPDLRPGVFRVLSLERKCATGVEAQIHRFAETFRLSGCAAIDAAITRGLPKIAVNTILDPDKLRSDLGNVRAQGFAYDDREFHDDMRCDFGARIGPWGLLRSLGTDDRRCHLEDRSFR